MSKFINYSDEYRRLQEAVDHNKFVAEQLVLTARTQTAKVKKLADSLKKALH